MKKQPIHVHPQNPRYFSDGSGRAIYLTGSHTWANLQDFHLEGEADFDYAAYLDFLEAHRHNFIRLWAIEHAAEIKPGGERVIVDPLPFRRTGPGLAQDGRPQFDLTQFNPAYFERLRERVLLARERGMYVAIMLFLWYSVSASEKDGDRWRFHPFHAANNVNGIDGDPDGTGTGNDTHTLRVPAVTAVQEAYARRVVDAVNDLDNVLYEIANESLIASRDWQYHLIRVIQDYEATQPYQHPVGMTAHMDEGLRHGLYEDLLNSPADWISPAMGDGGGNWREDPPTADGRKVILSDTDHYWGIGGDVQWVWKSFCRGLNPIFMDPWEPWPAISALWRTVNQRDYPAWEIVRCNMGYTRQYAERMDLAAAAPSQSVASTHYALVNPGVEYLVYQPTAGVSFLVQLEPGEYAYEWFHPLKGQIEAEGTLRTEGGRQSFTPPFIEQSVLYLRREKGE